MTTQLKINFHIIRKKKSHDKILREKPKELVRYLNLTL